MSYQMKLGRVEDSESFPSKMLLALNFEGWLVFYRHGGKEQLRQNKHYAWKSICMKEQKILRGHSNLNGLQYRYRLKVQADIKLENKQKQDHGNMWVRH